MKICTVVLGGKNALASSTRDVKNRLTTESVVRGRPPDFAGGIIGLIISHSPSVRISIGFIIFAAIDWAYISPF